MFFFATENIGVCTAVVLGGFDPNWKPTGANPGSLLDFRVCVMAPGIELSLQLLL